MLLGMAAYDSSYFADFEWLRWLLLEMATYDSSFFADFEQSKNGHFADFEQVNIVVILLTLDKSKT